LIFVASVLFDIVQLYCCNCTESKVMGAGRAPIAQPISSVCILFVTVLDFIIKINMLHLN